MTTPTRADEERILYLLFLECTLRQIELLEWHEKAYVKEFLKPLLSNSKRYIKEIRKNMTPETISLFENMYDYIYMTVRDAANVDAADVDEFRKLVQGFVAKKNEERRASIFQVN